MVLKIHKKKELSFKERRELLEPISENNKHDKYLKQKSVLNNLVGGFLSLAIATVGLSIATKSLASSGLIEDNSISMIRVPTGNEGRAIN